MEISLENLKALCKEETVTITIEDCKGEFTLTRSFKRFVIQAEDLRLEIGRPSGESPMDGLVVALLAWQAVSDIVGDWPEI